MIRTIRSIFPSAFQVQTQSITVGKMTTQAQTAGIAIRCGYAGVRCQHARRAQYRCRHAIANLGIQTTLQRGIVAGLIGYLTGAIIL